MQVNLDYFTRRHCAPQWRAFVSELVGEFYDQVEVELAESFFRRLGGRMAKDLPLGAASSLEDLEKRINLRLDQIDWGWVRLRETDQAIEVAHGAYPVVAPAGDAPDSWIVQVLEGLYTEWLNAIGGDDTLSARSTARPTSPMEIVRLAYRKHEEAS